MGYSRSDEPSNSTRGICTTLDETSKGKRLEHERTDRNEGLLYELVEKSITGKVLPRIPATYLG